MPTAIPNPGEPVQPDQLPGAAQPPQPQSDPNEVVANVNQGLLSLNDLVGAQAPEFQQELQGIIQSFQSLINKISGGDGEQDTVGGAGAGNIPEGAAAPIEASPGGTQVT